MSFLYPWFLVGLVAVGAPIWLHLRRKDREKVVPFTALRFLEDQPMAKRPPLQLKNVSALFAADGRAAACGGGVRAAFSPAKGERGDEQQGLCPGQHAEPAGGKRPGARQGLPDRRGGPGQFARADRRGGFGQRAARAGEFWRQRRAGEGKNPGAAADFGAGDDPLRAAAGRFSAQAIDRRGQADDRAFRRPEKPVDGECQRAAVPRAGAGEISLVLQRRGAAEFLRGGAAGAAGVRRRRGLHPVHRADRAHGRHDFRGRLAHGQRPRNPAQAAGAGCEDGQDQHHHAMGGRSHDVVAGFDFGDVEVR